MTLFARYRRLRRNITLFSPEYFQWPQSLRYAVTEVEMALPSSASDDDERLERAIAKCEDEFRTFTAGRPLDPREG